MAVLKALITYHESRQRENILLSSSVDETKFEYKQSVTSTIKEGRIGFGEFYSKNTSEVGEWNFEEGILTLKWERSGRSVEFVQKSVTSEADWKSEQKATDLRFTNLEGGSLLPMWLIPKDPNELFLEQSKRSKDKEMRSLIEEGTAREILASEFTECAVCFFELHLFPAAILRYQSKRICSHYFHSSCAIDYKARREAYHERVGCPICHKRFSEVKPLPDILEDPRMWFQLCDTDLTGSLDKKEVLEGLLAVLPVERARLNKSINDSWSDWDASGDGSVEMKEFIDPVKGLRKFLLKNCNVFRKSSTANAQLRSVPSLDLEPRKWFDYWDYNKSGTFERTELARALIKTYCVTAWGDPVLRRTHDMYQLAISIWDTLGYKPRDKLNFEEFVKPFGIADQVVHNVTHGQFFGDNEEDFSTA